MISIEKIKYYEQIFHDPGFIINNKFDDEMFKYWVFKEYEHVPLTKSQLVSELEYWSSIDCEYRVVYHKFMIDNFSEFIEYCMIKKL
jgi:hypothetical protein